MTTSTSTTPSRRRRYILAALTLTTSLLGLAPAQAQLPPLGTYYFHYDQHGDTVLVTDAGGAVTCRLRYSAYGEPLPGEDCSPAEAARFYTWGGARRDQATGLVHMGQRYYSPEQGRFLSPDPGLRGRRPQVSLYLGLGDNPLRYVDPDGRFFFAREGSVTVMRGEGMLRTVIPKQPAVGYVKVPRRLKQSIDPAKRETRKWSDIFVAEEGDEYRVASGYTRKELSNKKIRSELARIAYPDPTVRKWNKPYSIWFGTKLMRLAVGKDDYKFAPETDLGQGELLNLLLGPEPPSKRRRIESATTVTTTEAVAPRATTTATTIVPVTPSPHFPQTIDFRGQPPHFTDLAMANEFIRQIWERNKRSLFAEESLTYSETESESESE